MKHSIPLLSAIPFLAALGAFAQTAPVLSPEVHPDRSITFRLQAPQAQKAEFYGDWMPVGKPAPMEKGADGV